ncbi:MAG: toxin HipA [Gammaproteobacteria bacterium RIFCSPHIGHO2_12_FULL_41_15]|nr:MAG: toxin HipA [Gammaproteobacteria bacterium RIFCSPHIGHO2_12_FULL_41_15]
MKKNEKTIYVYADWSKQKTPMLVGTLHAIPTRSKLTFAFEYDTDWLHSQSAFTLDPSLQLYQGRQYGANEQTNFGIFLDSSPDRWGRLLMNRREVQRARQENRKPKNLLETDYLLGVYDEHRIGALRFKTNLNGLFLDNDLALAAPPWTSLRALEEACLALEKPNVENDPLYSDWLNMLVAPGGSLGGARPKASVLDERGHPWIAKFPSSHDEYDMGAWEMLIYHLARSAGIDMADSILKRFNSRHHTFLNKRFDRTDSQQRIHFASAMTLLQRSNGEDASTGVSYLELAEFITQQGARPVQDLHQLWRRIVFSMCVSNVDDHLRNHGFIFYPQAGWVLSPAFDMNPVAQGNGLKLNVSESDNAQDLSLAQEVAPYFRIKPVQSKQIIADIVRVVRPWHKAAKQLGISLHEQNFMERAFRLAY